jgi:hypothetical protein
MVEASLVRSEASLQLGCTQADIEGRGRAGHGDDGMVGRQPRSRSPLRLRHVQAITEPNLAGQQLRAALPDSDPAERPTAVHSFICSNRDAEPC